MYNLNKANAFIVIEFVIKYSVSNWYITNC